MAAPLDFSDLTGKKKKPLHQQITQQTNAQGVYSPDKVPEEKKQPQPGGMGYPTQQTQAGDELMQLFPTPLYILVPKNARLRIVTVLELRILI